MEQQLLSLGWLELDMLASFGRWFAGLVSKNKLTT